MWKSIGGKYQKQRNFKNKKKKANTFDILLELSLKTQKIQVKIKKFKILSVPLFSLLPLHNENGTATQYTQKVFLLCVPGIQTATQNFGFWETKKILLYQIPHYVQFGWYLCFHFTSSSLG